MTAIRRVWSPQDAQDAVVAARAVHAKGLAVGEDQRGVYLSGLIVDPMPVSKVPGRTRGRHRAKRFSHRVEDV